MDRLVIILAFGYGIGAVFALVLTDATIWQRLLAFWIGGAVATLGFGAVMRMLFWTGSSGLNRILAFGQDYRRNQRAEDRGYHANVSTSNMRPRVEPSTLTLAEARATKSEKSVEETRWGSN